MRKSLSAVTASVMLGLLGGAWMAVAEAQTTGERFGLGTFRYQDRTFVGVVMRYPITPQQIGGVVVELPPAANAANVTGIPNDLLSIVDQWGTVGPKVKQIVAQVGPTRCHAPGWREAVPRLAGDRRAAGGSEVEHTRSRTRTQLGGSQCALTGLHS